MAELIATAGRGARRDDPDAQLVRDAAGRRAADDSDRAGFVRDGADRFRTDDQPAAAAGGAAVVRRAVSAAASRERARSRRSARTLRGESSHIARVFAAAVRKWGKSAVEVEQAVLDEGERIANVLRRYLRVLNGVSTVSPLLGLLGTVWGMIQAFNVIATSPAMGRAEMLAGGISVALITTASGPAGGHSSADLLSVFRRPRGQPRSWKSITTARSSST